MNRGEIRDNVGFLLNYTEGQADQDFAIDRLNKGIDLSILELFPEA